MLELNSCAWYVMLGQLPATEDGAAGLPDKLLERVQEGARMFKSNIDTIVRGCSAMDNAALSRQMLREADDAALFYVESLFEETTKHMNELCKEMDIMMDKVNLICTLLDELKQ